MNTLHAVRANARCALRHLGWLLVLLGCAPSCNRYLIGHQTLYPPDIRTVYVPMFDSTSFRRYLGERLTEAVVKEIEVRTPYKVVNSPDADSILSGRILTENKNPLASAPTAEPRYLTYQMNVEVSWVNRTGKTIQPIGAIPVPQSIAQISLNSAFAPEAGMSVTTAQQADIERLARQIVSLMEAPW